MTPEEKAREFVDFVLSCISGDFKINRQHVIIRLAQQFEEAVAKNPLPLEGGTSEAKYARAQAKAREIVDANLPRFLVGTARENELIEAIAAAMLEATEGYRKLPDAIGDAEIERLARETFINWNGSWNSAIGLDGEAPGLSNFKAMRHCYLCGFSHAFRKAMELPQMHQTFGFKLVANPSVPAGEAHFRNDKGETVGKIVNLPDDSVQREIEIEAKVKQRIQEFFPSEEEIERMAAECYPQQLGSAHGAFIAACDVLRRRLLGGGDE